MKKLSTLCLLVQDGKILRKAEREIQDMQAD